MSLQQVDNEGDNLGGVFAPKACSHAYTYDSSNNVITDTATTLDGKVRVKTFTYYTGTANVQTASIWVVQ